MTARYKILTIITFLTIAILPFSGGCSEVPGTYDPLFLSIDSPQDHEVVKTNLIKVTGKTSDSQASVLVNGKKAIIDTTGNYFAYIEIPEGANSIKASTTIDGEKYVYNIDISFEPPFVVFFDSHHIDNNTDYRSVPLEIGGFVSNPEARVTVNEIPANVKSDGDFTVKIPLVVGENWVTAEAMSGGEKVGTREIIMLSSEGKVATPWYRTPMMMDIFHEIPIKTGETVCKDLRLSSGLRFRGQDELHWEIYRVIELYGEEEIPAPEGLDVIAEPPTFKIHPGRGYPSTIIITAAADVTPGKYYYRIQAKVDEGGLVAGFTVIVES